MTAVFSWKMIGPRCQRKTRFETKLAAKQQAARINARGRNVRAYRCVYCEGFHIGTKQGG
jgi:hypothetical protein